MLQFSANLWMHNSKENYTRSTFLLILSLWSGTTTTTTITTTTGTPSSSNSNYILIYSFIHYHLPTRVFFLFCLSIFQSLLVTVTHNRSIFYFLLHFQRLLFFFSLFLSASALMTTLLGLVLLIGKALTLCICSSVNIRCHFSYPFCSVFVPMAAQNWLTALVACCLPAIGKFEISTAFCRWHLPLFLCSVYVTVCFSTTLILYNVCLHLSLLTLGGRRPSLALIVISWQYFLQHLPIYMFAHTGTLFLFLFAH